MSREFEQFKNALESQKNELLSHIARLSMAMRFDWEIPDPDEESPPIWHTPVVFADHPCRSQWKRIAMRPTC